MPTNLPPEYFNADKRFREAETTAEKIACLEEILSIIPKHKGTDHLRADYRRKLSQLKAESQERKSGGKHVSAFHIPREGAGQVAVIGTTNTGKSALVRALTHATPEVSEAPYTTWQPTPGMMTYEKVPIQLVDTPALDREFIEPALFDLIRHADLLLLMVDIQASPDEQLEVIVNLLAEHSILPQGAPVPQVSEHPPTGIPALVVVNKCDDAGWDEDYQILRELLGDDWPMLPISVTERRLLEQLKQAVYERLDVIRVYSKEPGKEPDLDVPFAVKRGTTVEELAAKIHKDFFAQLKSARVWGSGAFGGQSVPRDHILQDGDVVEFKI